MKNNFDYFAVHEIRHVPVTAEVRGNGIALRSLKEAEGPERMLLEEVR